MDRGHTRALLDRVVRERTGNTRRIVRSSVDRRAGYSLGWGADLPFSLLDEPMLPNGGESQIILCCGSSLWGGVALGPLVLRYVTSIYPSTVSRAH